MVPEPVGFARLLLARVKPLGPWGPGPPFTSASSGPERCQARFVGLPLARREPLESWGAKLAIHQRQQRPGAVPARFARLLLIRAEPLAGSPFTRGRTGP